MRRCRVTDAAPTRRGGNRRALALIRATSDAAWLVSSQGAGAAENVPRPRKMVSLGSLEVHGDDETQFQSVTGTITNENMDIAELDVGAAALVDAAWWSPSHEKMPLARSEA